jgi:hypothetical protein
VLSLRPGLGGDFVDVGTDHVRFEGDALARYRVGPAHAIGFGMTIDGELGGVYALPLLVYGLRTEHLRVDARLPERLEALYVPFGRLGVGIAARFQGGVFGVGGEGAPVDRLGLSTLLVGPVLEVRVVSAIRVDARGGLALARRFDLAAGDVDRRSLGLDPAPWFGGGVSCELRERACARADARRRGAREGQKVFHRRLRVPSRRSSVLAYSCTLRASSL